MTIKVCKQKFKSRLNIVGIVVANIVCMSLIILFVIGVHILLSNADSMGGFILVLFGGIFAFVFNCMYLAFGTTHWFQLIQSKYKLFEWNNDC